MTCPLVSVVGEVLWDHHADGPLETARSFERILGGAAANVALKLASLGVSVAALGVVGNDALGRGLVHSLARAKVDTSAMLLRRGQTGSVFIEPFRDGGQRFYSYRPTVTWPRVPKLPETWRRRSLTGRLLHIAAVNPEELDVMLRLVQQVVRRAATVTIDINARPRAWRGVRMTRNRRRDLAALLAHATWVKASDDDLRVLDVPPDPKALGLAPAATLIVTRGKRPMTVVGPMGEANLRPPRLQVQHSIGAGDAFSACLLNQFLHQAPTRMADWKRAVRAASASAGAHLQRAGEERRK